MCEVKVKLFSNGGKEDKEAFFLLLNNEIPFINFGPTSDTPTPIVEYGHWKYIGLEQINQFVSRWKTGELPSLNLAP